MALKLREDKLSLIFKEIFLYYIKKIDCSVVNYRFNYTENISLDNFCKEILNNRKQYININWIFDFFNYQFTYWDFIKREKEKSGESLKIMLHWIIGSKALNRYLNRTNKDTYFYHSVFFPKYNIKKEDIINFLIDKGLIEDLQEIQILNNIEEEYKKINFGKIEGFYNCINYTTLFKFNSPICSKCIYKNNCKVLLKKTYPDLYQKRLSIKIKNG